MLSIASLSLGVPSLLEARTQWADFKSTYNKSYSADEEETRFKTFLNNLAIIEKRNQAEGPDGATHGVTKFMDLTPEEFKATYLRATSGPKTHIEQVALPELAAGETASKDWTGIYTTPVKDQGQCGSCWAFSAVEQIESDVMRELNQKFVLSPEQVVACDRVDQGCNGGNTETAYQYVKESAGIVTEKEYPYTSGSVGGQRGGCKTKDLKNPPIDLSSFKTVKRGANGASGVESAMAKYVAQTGPLSICVDAESWQTYTGGVLKRCGNQIDHCVQAVGIDTSEGVWKVRNSWNTNWGEDGFIRLKYGRDMCGLTNDATWTTDYDATPSPAPLEEEEAPKPVRDVLDSRPKEVAALRESIATLEKDHQ